VDLEELKLCDFFQVGMGTVGDRAAIMALRILEDYSAFMHIKRKTQKLGSSFLRYVLKS